MCITSLHPGRQTGVFILEYGLVIAAISLLLVIALGLGMGGVAESICELGGRVSRLLGGAAADCGG
jgi:Flp pilus assembly pilin Flp